MEDGWADGEMGRGILGAQSDLPPWADRRVPRFRPQLAKAFHFVLVLYFMRTRLSSFCLKASDDTFIGSSLLLHSLVCLAKAVLTRSVPCPRRW
jgi:hypothetical protein